MSDEALEYEAGHMTKDLVKGISITLVAAIVAFLLYKFLPYGENENKGLSLLAFIAIMWFTEATHITITALMVPILGVLFSLPTVNPATKELVAISTKKALSTFADPIIFLFFGGFALATALHIQKLDKKIAMKIISLSGSHLGVATILIALVTAFLSMWISNTATAAMMLPLALGMLSHFDSEKDRGTFVFILLAIAFSASIGGIGTMVGSPPNAIASVALGYSFADWMKIGLPIVIIFLPMMLICLFLICKPNLNRKVDVHVENIPWTPKRVLTMIVFVVTALAWILGSYIKDLGISSPDTWVAITAAIAVVMLGLATWKDISNNTNWGVLFLFGGGLTLSAILKDSGASLVLGQELATTFGSAHPLIIIGAVALFIIIITEFTSNTASAALLVPVFAAIAVQMNMPEEVLVIVIGIGASCAFMLPVATPPNAIVFGTGLIKQKEMLKVGSYLNFACAIVLTLFAYFFLL